MVLSPRLLQASRILVKLFCALSRPYHLCACLKTRQNLDSVRLFGIKPHRYPLCLTSAVNGFIFSACCLSFLGSPVLSWRPLFLFAPITCETVRHSPDAFPARVPARSASANTRPPASATVPPSAQRGLPPSCPIIQIAHLKIAQRRHWATTRPLL